MGWSGLISASHRLFLRTDLANRTGEEITVRRNGRPPPRACAAQGIRCTVRAHAFLRLPPPRWAFSSPGPCPHQGSFPQESGAMITSPPAAPLAALLQRVREQYRDMPGLTLTKPQAMRLFGVAPSVCAAVLRALVMENFLSP